MMMPEPSEDLGLMASAGQLWSTTRDLARFAMFLVRGDERVLSSDSLREMRTSAAPTESVAEPGYGFGLQLMDGSGRRFVGHGGRCPASSRGCG